MQGTVERIEKKGRRTAMQIDGRWYSTFEEIGPISEGDRVAFSFKTVEKNGREYRNLKAIEVLREASMAGVAATEELTASAAGKAQSESERIARSVALKCAVEACGPQVETAEVVATAEAFLGFLLGEHDKAGRDDGRFRDRTALTDDENPF
jgi:hypothetical protein